MQTHPPAADSFTLPMHISNGLVLSGVELECRGCGQHYRLTRGHGRAGAAGGRVALAGQCHCPHCGTGARFLVLVDPVQRRARVQRVSRLGLTVATWLMKLSEPYVEDGEQATPIKALPPLDVIRSTEVAGHYLGQDIPAWIEVDGQRCPYAGLVRFEAQGAARLSPGEYALAPGLLYRASLDFRA